MATKQGFRMYYTKGVAIGTKVSLRSRESGCLSGLVVKRGSTLTVLFLFVTTDPKYSIDNGLYEE